MINPSILLIQSKVANNSPFSVNEGSLSDIEIKLRSLNPKKVWTFKNIPPNIPQENIHCCSGIPQKFFNNTLTNKEFPHKLKVADVTPIYKKMILINRKTIDL